MFFLLRLASSSHTRNTRTCWRKWFLSAKLPADGNDKYQAWQLKVIEELPQHLDDEYGGH